MPINCVEVDGNGLCTKCQDVNFRIILGQCVLFPNCKDRQYLNSNNQCIDVNPDCRTWNPSNGQCITCQNGNGPWDGICCPTGQIQIDGNCVWQQNGTNGTSLCIIVHPLINICLLCKKGYAPDYGISYGCFPKWLNIFIYNLLLLKSWTFSKKPYIYYRISDA